MNPIIRRLILQYAEKALRAAYHAYKNVSKAQGHDPNNIFEHLKAQMQTMNQSKLSIEEAHRILNLDSDSTPSMYTIQFRYNTLMAKNAGENGGSEYMRSKIQNSFDLLKEWKEKQASNK